MNCAGWGEERRTMVSSTTRLRRLLGRLAKTTSSSHFGLAAGR